MPIERRAHQLMPFASLPMYFEELDEVKRHTSSKIELEKDSQEQINRSLSMLVQNRDIEAQFTWFQRDSRKEGGSYINTTGSVKSVDTMNGTLTISDGTVIPIHNITDIEICESSSPYTNFADEAVADTDEVYSRPEEF